MLVTMMCRLLLAQLAAEEPEQRGDDRYTDNDANGNARFCA